MNESKSLYVNGELVCEEVGEANSLLRKVLGRMFTLSMPEEYALVFDFEELRPIPIHMVFVLYSLGVVWVEDGEVVNTKELAPWFGYHDGFGDMVIEVHPDKLDQIEAGDKIEIK